MPPLLLPRDASARYQEIALASRLLGVDGHGLVEILYEELVQALDVLDARLRRGSVSLHEASATRARSILAALLTSLDPAQGQATELFAQVYRGMIVGEHTRDNDLEINVLKGKQLTNIRTQSKDEAVRLTPPIRMTLEKALAYIEDDERVEVTPKSVRLRKTYLDPNDRKRAERSKDGI